MTDTCAPIRSELSALRARRTEQAELVAGLPNNAGKQHAQEVLDGIIADIADAEAELALCEARADQAENPQDLAITGRVETVVCHAASSEVLVDEPYLLIASFDMANSVNLGVVGFTLPAIDVFKIGPWLGVNEGDTLYASHLASNPALPVRAAGVKALFVRSAPGRRCWSRWSARSEARTNDLDQPEGRCMLAMGRGLMVRRRPALPGCSTNSSSATTSLIGCPPRSWVRGRVNVRRPSSTDAGGHAGCGS
jgi:hypothetical protein